MTNNKQIQQYAIIKEGEHMFTCPSTLSIYLYLPTCETELIWLLVCIRKHDIKSVSFLNSPNPYYYSFPQNQPHHPHYRCVIPTPCVTKTILIH